jgi:hypothetical protein
MDQQCGRSSGGASDRPPDYRPCPARPTSTWSASSSIRREGDRTNIFAVSQSCTSAG